MRLFLPITAMLAIVALGGCAATKQEVSESLGSRFVGKNVDTLISEFGPPSSAFRMNSGETAYVWQLSAVTNIDTNKCKASSGGTRISSQADRRDGYLCLSDIHSGFYDISEHVSPCTTWTPN